MVTWRRSQAAGGGPNGAPDLESVIRTLSEQLAAERSANKRHNERHEKDANTIFDLKYALGDRHGARYSSLLGEATQESAKYGSWTPPAAVTNDLAAKANGYTESWASGKDVAWCTANRNGGYTQYTRDYIGWSGWFVAQRHGVNTITNVYGKTIEICGTWASVCAQADGQRTVAGHLLQETTCGTARAIIACAHEHNTGGVFSSDGCQQSYWETPLT